LISVSVDKPIGEYTERNFVLKIPISGMRTPVHALVKSEVKSQNFYRFFCVEEAHTRKKTPQIFSRPEKKRFGYSGTFQVG